MTRTPGLRGNLTILITSVKVDGIINYVAVSHSKKHESTAAGPITS